MKAKKANQAKKLLCGALAAGILCGSVPLQAATDANQSATVLNALGIMQGNASGNYALNEQLTRAQFCKMAVTALGIDDVTPFQNYTVFPDVPSTYWAAGYINAAVKQKDIKDKQIIRGYANGSFAPEHALTFAETCTMLLRMLGYTVEDIGPYWPTDYIAKTRALDILEGVSAYGTNDVIKRGDAAIMLLNTLQATPKEGEKLINLTAASSVLEEAILLATAETDSTLRQGQARFYANGGITSRTVLGTIDKSLVGLRGTVLFDKDETTKACAFVPDNSEMDTMLVRRATTTALTDDEGNKIEIPRETIVVQNNDIGAFNAVYFDLMDKRINLYYDKNHNIELITLSNSTAASGSYVYGTVQAGNLPQNYPIVKNGAQIERSDLKKYDLVTVDAANKQVVVNDRRITGYYLEATPAFSAPSSITMLGNTYTISDNAARYFSRFKYKDRITLLLDDYGTVRAAFPANEVKASMVGIISNGNAEGGTTVSLLNGIQVSGKLTSESSRFVGRLATITDDIDGNISATAYNLSDIVPGDWSVTAGNIGNRKVSADVAIYEMSSDDASLTRINRNDVQESTIPKADIRGVVTDSSGSVIAIMLDDYTGSGWQYGYASSMPHTDEQEDTIYTINFVTFENGEAVTHTYTGDKRSTGITGIIGLPKGITNSTAPIYIPSKDLRKIYNISLSAFDGTSGVRTAQGYFPIAEDAGVYVKDYDRMISIQEAKANFKNFTAYTDDTLENGGMIRIFTVNS